MTVVNEDQAFCPDCGSKWQGEDIFECFMKKKEEGDPHYADKTEDEIKEFASYYGWTEDDPKCFSRLIGIEIQGKYDGVSYWKCPDCASTWNRWTGEKVNLNKE